MATDSVQNAWRTYIQEGRNFRTESRKQIEKFVQRLVKEGQLRSDQVQASVDDIQKRSEKAVDDFRKRVRGVMQDELKRVGVATKSDLDKLERKIGRVEKQVTGIKKPAAKRATKSSTSKKSPASRSRSTTTKKSPARRSSSTKK